MATATRCAARVRSCTIGPVIQDAARSYEQAWKAVVSADGPPPPVEVTGAPGQLPARLPVEEVALACVSAALAAADALDQQRGGTRSPLGLDREHVAAAVRSEQFFRWRGHPAGASFAPLSRFWTTADGWIRTHANYPWHRRALLRTLDIDEDIDDDVDTVATAIAQRAADELQEQIVASGGVAAAVRTLEAWQSHPQGRALAAEPLVSHHVAGNAASRARAAAELPASGIRVLDLTRVIAGPVCTRFLGALGADVLRIDPPHLPDGRIGEPSDTLLAKRSALLDFGHDVDTDLLHDLLDRADVLVSGYRRGSLHHFGLTSEALAERHPGLVVVALDAWGHTGPWADRRGFDSIVQAATGIAVAESTDGKTPGALPCQLLDHGTGYLAAAAALDGLRRQMRDGGTHVRQLSLARTAWWLAASPNRSTTTSGRRDPAVKPHSWIVDISGQKGTATVVAPPGRIGDRALSWPGSPAFYGDDEPQWRSR